MKIIVLGAGLVGSAIASDLAKDKGFKVTSVDLNEENLKKLKNPDIETKVVDVSIPENLTPLLKNCDIAVNALPGFLGYSTLETIINSKTDVVDLAFYAEDPFKLDELAKKKNVTAIVDFGVCPGVSNIIVGKTTSFLDKTESVKIFVGGLPQTPQGIFDYTAVFSPTDVIEEYIRPARLISNGEMVVKPALSEIDVIDFEHVGTLEAFNSDGLRTLLKTTKAKNMVEKTLRFPGHAKRMEFLREFGFFDEEKIKIGRSKISPMQFTSKVLEKVWHSDSDAKDFIVVKIEITGTKRSESVKFVYSMYDKYDERNNITAMARTTGYSAAMGVRIIAKNLYNEKGIIPPEYIGKKEKSYNFFMSGLAERGVIIKKL
ncbi:MAG: saccharopine dehydrogenase NADP-binding domain-containing protein [Melioribacteraceae bacterium]|nr:saccharopine dehydrogenase NADP-binding domain-containing protein [Melioribacteraceae bacterium]MCF8263056.1 saccharopine dehydrogenase NADP-binding domain-containing protein [Melioribacteraceae bacterium]MCF8413851.1 saccharopine dehydrogenase NADP-binding domain-containing protein [Melioribacteraceae bacterium]MCF8431252.1 saccharopine dehydrogenase NADP-binding domain-containing protein [Melioribacteraceae bacterium]